MTITVYVADGCPHCARLLLDLERRGVRHACVNLSSEPERAAEVVRLTWERRVPVTVDHERFTVGHAGASSTFDEVGIVELAGESGRA